MNSLLQFQARLNRISDDELYNIAKSHLDVFNHSDYRNIRKLELIYDECQKRNLKIYEKAIKDAYLSDITPNAGFSENPKLVVHRIDFMTENEILQLINSIRKGYRKEDILISYGSDYDIYDLIGIPEDFLMVLRVSGNSMIEEGISNGNIVLADRRIHSVKDKLIIVNFEGELFIKRLVVDKEGLSLYSANEKIKPFRINISDRFRIMAIVRHIIKIMK